MAEISLSAKTRELSTKGTKNKLRREGFVPGIFYSSENQPVPIVVSELGLKPFVYTSENHIVKLNIDEKKEQNAILKDIQFHPITDRIVHFDLLGLTKGHKLTVQVPVNLVGDPIGVREGGVLQQSLYKLDVECLPKDMPEHIAIEIANLGIGDSIHIKDIEVENIKILNNEQAIVVSVEKTRGSSDSSGEEIDGLEESAEPEVINKGKSDEEAGE